MTEIVNLRRARKAKARSEAEKTAAENRAKFGAGKAEKQIVDAREALEKRRLDQHKLAQKPSGESDLS